jgi:hypothetical protein
MLRRMQFRMCIFGAETACLRHLHTFSKFRWCEQHSAFSTPYHLPGCWNYEIVLFFNNSMAQQNFVRIPRHRGQSIAMQNNPGGGGTLRQILSARLLNSYLCHARIAFKANFLETQPRRVQRNNSKYTTTLLLPTQQEQCLRAIFTLQTLRSRILLRNWRSLNWLKNSPPRYGTRRFATAHNWILVTELKRFRGWEGNVTRSRRALVLPTSNSWVLLPMSSLIFI